jgi:hypothetical protein
LISSRHFSPVIKVLVRLDILVVLPQNFGQLVGRHLVAEARQCLEEDISSDESLVTWIQFPGEK